MIRYRAITLSLLAAAGTGWLGLHEIKAQAKYGTPEEARAMLDRAVAAVKADKAKALAEFNAGADGFRDRDLQPFCWDIKTGATVASTVPANVGRNQCEMKDKAGKEFGKEICAAAATEGKVTQIYYMFPRPGETEPAPKVSFVTRAGDIGCAVGYYK
jgi:signal transduction histidine kinase